MKLDSSSKSFFLYNSAIVMIVLLVGALSSVYTFKKVSESTQMDLLKNAASIASAFDPEDILLLTGSETDLENPVYLSLKSKLQKIPLIDADVRFVYLWGYRDGNPFFFADSEPSTSEDYSPPGQIYEEATEADRAVLLKEMPSAIEISSDRWGTWLTALAPIMDEQGQVIAVMGMDMSAGKYFRNLYIYTAIPVFATIFVLLLLVIGFMLRRKEHDFMSFRSELVSIASHEIRSPLTGICWLTSSILITGQNLSSEQKDNVNIIKHKSEELLMTVNDLLDVASAERVHKKELVKVPIPMRKLFEEIEKDSFLILGEKDIKLVVDPSVNNDLVISGDSERINRLFNNLVSNAVKYSKNASTVTISVENRGENFIFSVKDEGIGIPEKDQEKIFKGFFRSENAKKTTRNGTGLGLHYVQQIAELHKGKVWCRSKEGIGSIFYVELPKKG